MTLKEQFKQALFTEAGDEQIAEDVAINFLAYSQSILPLTKENEKILREFYQAFKKEIYGTDDMAT